MSQRSGGGVSSRERSLASHHRFFSLIHLTKFDKLQLHARHCLTAVSDYDQKHSPCPSGACSFVRERDNKQVSKGL